MLFAESNNIVYELPNDFYPTAVVGSLIALIRM